MINTLTSPRKFMLALSGLITIVLTGVATPAAYADGRVYPQQAIANVSEQGAPGGPLRDRKVSVDVQNAPLRSVINDIVAQSKLQLSYSAAIIPANRQVTIRLSNVSASDALSAVLRGTGVQVHVMAEGQLALVRAPKSQSLARNVIAGTVADAKTGKGISGATVSIGSDISGVTTGEDGTYRLTGVSSGTHIIKVRLVGYAKQTRQVTIGEGATVTVDFKMEPSANVLDQVVVTGTAVATELRAVPNAINVITAKQIEERGITRIDQLFRGEIPGLFSTNSGSNSLLDEVVMFSRGATALSFYSAGTDGWNTNPIKTYIDGVELSDPRYLSQIDPKSIERIEILTGPQASTIYGSNAINGVMQIFTKRGATSRPQLNLSLLSGWVENNFSSARTPQHDYSVQISGVEGRLSYNAGGSWNYMGPWTPAKQTTRISSFGGTKIEIPTALGRMTGDITFRRSITNSRQRGNATQTLTGYRETGWFASANEVGLDRPTDYTLVGQTLGVVIGYLPTSWWSHELGLGTDVSDKEQRYTARGYLNISDTVLLLQQNYTNRRSLRYQTTAKLPVTAFVQTTLALGADTWQNMTSSVFVMPQTLVGTLTGSTSIRRQPGHNSGGFVQTQVGIVDRLFLTYGLRAEWNPAYGDEAQPNYAPRYGVAYTQEFGRVTGKIRGSYGRSTRPPQLKLKVAQTAAEVYGADWSLLSPYWPNFDLYMANPELAPEQQKGGEGGVELYLGSRGSLAVTRYNQTVDGLIAEPIFDSVRSLEPCPSSACFPEALGDEGYGYRRQKKYLNIGSIRNQGWEMQGNVQLGPLTTRGTYSWTKSRTLGVNPKYRAQFASQSQYTPGATFKYIPEHSWSTGLTYARSASSISLNVTGVGRVTNQANDFSFKNLDTRIRLQQNRQSVSTAGGRYVYFNAGYALTDLAASHRFSTSIEGVLQVQNLADRYVNDIYAGSAIMGRQAKVGFRVR